MSHLFLSILCIILIFCGGCANEAEKFVGKYGGDKKYLAILPPALQNEPISFDLFLKEYKNLNLIQREIVLDHLLMHKGSSETDRSQYAYMLGRLLQQRISKNPQNQILEDDSKAALFLFNKSKTFLPLKKNSLWHISEIGILRGEEKIVRNALSELLGLANTGDTKAEVQYAFAQSYLRGGEIDKARESLQKIRVDFPETDYALGSGYYLGTLAYAEMQREQKKTGLVTSIKQPESQVATMLINTALFYYLEYLQKSPNGRFSKDITEKLVAIDNKNPKLLSRQMLAVLGSAYYANGEFKKALEYWRRLDKSEYAVEKADCLSKLNKDKAAEQEFLQAVKGKKFIENYLSVAEDISNKLNKTEAIQFWNILNKLKVPDQDRVLWNLAIRSHESAALNYYQQILDFYPQSKYSPSSQWRIFWHRIKTGKEKNLADIGNWCKAAEEKYSQSKIAPRFLFWAGKIDEALLKNEEALACYTRCREIYPDDYYGQRAAARYAELKNNVQDNYFSEQNTNYEYEGWDWPLPVNSLSEMQGIDNDTLLVLIHLKQYDEALNMHQDVPLEIICCLEGRTDQALQAINTAARALQALKRGKTPVPATRSQWLWQYSYPLLYGDLISEYCYRNSIRDPFLLHALIREESHYNRYATSSANAVGLCQLMPQTAASLAKKSGIKNLHVDQLYDPGLNIKLGAVYLGSLVKGFDGNILYAVAGYNAGGGAVSSQLKHNHGSFINDPDYFVENFPYKETRDYIRKVFSSYYLYRHIYH